MEENSTSKKDFLSIPQQKFLVFVVVFTVVTLLILYFIESKSKSLIPILNTQQQLPNIVSVSGSTTNTESQSYNGYRSYEQWFAGQLANLVNNSEIPKDWTTVEQKDLGITLKIPSNYKENIESDKDYLHFYLESYGRFTTREADEDGGGSYLSDLYSNPTYDYFYTKNSFKVYIDHKKENDKTVTLALQLPYLVNKNFLFIKTSEENLSNTAKIVSSVQYLLPTISKFKSYINPELGFSIDFPVSGEGSTLTEINIPGPRGFFQVGIKDLINIKTVPKGYICECDAGIKSVNSTFPKEDIKNQYMPVTYFTNKQGIVYAVITSKIKPEDDELGEALHVGEKIFVLKTNNPTYPVVNIVATNAYEGVIAEYMVNSFRLYP